jgi:5-hydroxyisourate hydrolase-like protein (transthyretin family)
VVAVALVADLAVHALDLVLGEPTADLAVRLADGTAELSSVLASIHR